MIFDAFGDINWLAVVVAAVAFFILGAIWYAPPVLGKAWMRAANVRPQGGPNPMLFAATFVLYLVTAAAIALLAAATGAESVGDGIALGAVIGVGIAFPGVLSPSLYEQRPAAYVWINGLYVILASILIAVIVTLWD